MSAQKNIPGRLGTHGTSVLILGCGTLLGVIGGRGAPVTEAGGIEFFEKKIRPVLAENCHRCHSHKAEKLKAGLYLDSREGLLRGGESGEVVVPREPNKSRLIEAVRYADPDLQMPPKKKLPDTIIADLIEWVKMGAPWPEEPAPGLAKTKSANSEADTLAFLNERRKHWAYQPVRSVAIPAVKNPAWCASEIDSFILAKLEQNSLPPASPADRRTLIRRATYDLIGLPPTRGEVDEFLRDSSQDAFAKVVDRLLASPHYGERWARHWLDLIRFSETLGFEFDFDLYNSWRYRDYVIRAFNTDLPYNQFVVEHFAGDLVPQPRRDPIERFNESIVATGFFWMGEGRQTPVDIRQEQADIIDGQIDVLGKAFLAQTIACARCHDHKFDAITTQDYYALAGYLKSSRYQQAFIDPPDRIAAKARELAALKKRIRDLVAGELAVTWVEQTARSSRYLLAAQRILNGAGPKEIAQEFGLDEAQLERWVKALQQKEVNTANHPLYAWVHIGCNKEPKADEFLQRRNALLAALREQMDKAARAAESAQVYENFHRPGYEGWHATGAAFDAGPGQPGDIILGDQPDRPVGEFVSRGAHSGLLSTRLQGELRSRTFTITKPFIHWLVAGKNARVNLIIDGYTLIMNPMYGGLTIAATNERPAWRTMAADRWIGHRAYFEICDSTVPMHRLNPPPSTARVPEGPAEGYVFVKQICFSDEGTPPAEAPNRFNIQALDQAGCENAEALAEAYQRLMAQELEQWRSGKTADKPDHEEGTALLNWLLQNGLLDKPARSGDLLKSAIRNPQSEIDQLGGLMNQYRAIESTLRSPLRTPALADGTGEDESVFVRGNYRTLGQPVTRRPPEVFTSTQISPSPPQKEERAGERRAIGTAQGGPHPNPLPAAQSEGEAQARLAGRSKHLIPSVTGSGRLELARHLVDPSNPLMARVMVNRIWQHHFGEGIVRTPDDFGRMGQPPTHPELLDYLAGEFVRRGWSFKAMHRLMMLTSAYKMSSKVDMAQRERDPENRWLHHMPVRRLEAEAIRDAILAISGRLNRTTYGPSTLPYLTPYMEGRGRPNSGPLDGDGRRSIYTNARRNFPVPMLVAFDFPVHFSTHGRREVSAVPEQAMTLMNDPFVAQQARRWATRALAEPSRTPEQRIDALYQTAFSRPPSEMELSHARLFLERQAKRYGGDLNDLKAWADLCHVLINVKEFIFVN